MTAVDRLHRRLAAQSLWTATLAVVRKHEAAVDEVFAMVQTPSAVNARRELFALYLRRGLSVDEIAALFVCHPNSVYMHTRELRAKPAPRPATPPRPTVAEALAATRANVLRMAAAGGAP